MFDVITVREDSGINLVKDHLRLEATQVLDPTMLLEKEDYIKLFEAANTPISKGTLLNYVLNPSKEKKAFIERVAKERHLIPFSVNNALVKKTSPTEDRILPPLESWLRGFHDAKFVITDSFHACVFSILFDKPFVAIGNKDRGLSRFKNLLGKHKLEDNLMVDMKKYKQNKDYKSTCCYGGLLESRKQSLRCIINCLSDEYNRSLINA